MRGKLLNNGLTLPLERFCVEAMKPGATLTSAYLIAFPNSSKWKTKTVSESASRAAAQPAVAARMNELSQKISKMGIVSIEEALMILSYISRADIRKCFDKNGKLKKPADIDDETAIALGEFSAKEGKAKMLNRKDAVESLLRWYVAKGHSAPAPNGEAPPIEETNNAYDWARRIAFTLNQGAPKQVPDNTT